MPGALAGSIPATSSARTRGAHFMVPRFVRIRESLPKTATHKIQKAELRQEGITVDTWDRDAAGIVVKRERLRG